MNKPQIIEEILSRKSFGNGLYSASNYMREFGRPSGVSQDVWTKSLKEAEHCLVYCDPNAEFMQKSIRRLDGNGSGGILEFDAVLMTKNQDRDGDIVNPSGLIIDDRMPLLWHHQMSHPVGAMRKILDRNSDLIRVKSVVADTSLGRDTAALIEVGALRISQGFKPTEATPLTTKMDKTGKRVPGSWLVKKGKTIEHSVVSIPANEEAIIEAYSRKSLGSDVAKSWAKKHFDGRTKLFPGFDSNTYELTTRIGESEITIKSTDKDFVQKMIDSPEKEQSEETTDDANNTDDLSNDPSKGTGESGVETVKKFGTTPDEETSGIKSKDDYSGEDDAVTDNKGQGPSGEEDMQSNHRDDTQPGNSNSQDDHEVENPQEGEKDDDKGMSDKSDHVPDSPQRKEENAEMKDKEGEKSKEDDDDFEKMKKQKMFGGEDKKMKDKPSEEADPEGDDGDVEEDGDDSDEKHKGKEKKCDKSFQEDLVIKSLLSVASTPLEELPETVVKAFDTAYEMVSMSRKQAEADAFDALLKN